MSQLSENIKYLRETSDISQKDFGKGFGVSRDNIASYERGSEPKLEFLQKLVNFYHISMEELVNSDLKAVCEGEEKLDLKIRPKSDLIIDPSQTIENSTSNKVAETIVPFKNNINSDSNIYKIHLERIETLSAENAVLKKENAELRAENSKLRGSSSPYNKQMNSAS